MNLTQAIKAIYYGEKVALPEWGGYWYLGEDGTIKVHTKDGKETDTPWFGKYADREDWQVLLVPKEPYDTRRIGSFGNAIQALENGHCVQREGWNGKGMFVVKSRYLP